MERAPRAGWRLLVPRRVFWCTVGKTFSLLWVGPIEISWGRDVEIKAPLTQRRALKGRLVYPLSIRGLKECPSSATMGFNCALWVASGGP